MARDQNRIGTGKKMKIALIGTGKMGQMIEKIIAETHQHQITAKFNKTTPFTLETAKLAAADVYIDFSQSDCVLKHIEICAELRKPIVIGTTGWDAQLTEAKKLIDKHQIGCFYAPNFSIGVTLFSEIVAHAAVLLNSFDEYDVGGVEWHHRHKADAPSGTAKALTKVLLDNMSRSAAPQFTSVRCGSIPGTHTIEFDSPVDSITLTHTARSREGFARGAVRAAEWLQGKQGFFTMKDLIGSI